ncbi:hypothetical protein SARC_05300 [Sphaeroforma arctica JP610]|uniref:Uncharacterized protein n=1 Tax=Sphaeroforma arctica JP610 TaxID=667725 RepID=A0A0L0G0M0_9EUKA|nr:hypothetical protein SARC_05300 [Sphaeroforma arctica JP610]KNC82404.1 hypothetical protein SARC_05300 [Sphaeroforma arctica JP610]|eukprot:XP_014156306.1 hypothetical protein SARC_05300 [Sphaeroforma arctica JP610]
MMAELGFGAKTSQNSWAKRIVITRDRTKLIYLSDFAKKGVLSIVYRLAAKVSSVVRDTIPPVDTCIGLLKSTESGIGIDSSYMPTRPLAISALQLLASDADLNHFFMSRDITPDDRSRYSSSTSGTGIHKSSRSDHSPEQPRHQSVRHRSHTTERRVRSPRRHMRAHSTNATTSCDRFSVQQDTPMVASDISRHRRLETLPGAPSTATAMMQSIHPSRRGNLPAERRSRDHRPAHTTPSRHSPARRTRHRRTLRNRTRGLSSARATPSTFDATTLKPLHSFQDSQRVQSFWLEYDTELKQKAIHEPPPSHEDPYLDLALVETWP